MESRARLKTGDREAARKAERVRYDAQHRPVDSLGQDYSDFGPNPPMREPAIGGDRNRRKSGGTLDPYHRDEPGEDSPEGSPARPKAQPVHQVTEDGKLYEPAREDKVRREKPKPA